MEEIQHNQTEPSRTLASVIRGETATGDLRIYPFQSRIYRNDRFLRVWVPPGYDDAENAARQYPVLYLNDGQNLFEPATSFNGVEWQVDETADRLIRERVIPPLIIVGIDNAGKDRVREYMPHRSFQSMMLRVQGTRYPSFLMKEVMPFVERHYRVLSGPRNTGLGGSSLGALIALYTVAVSPGIFGRLLLESPSLWAANRQIIR
jgi:enterochelin esterase-like enzyme